MQSQLRKYQLLVNRSQGEPMIRSLGNPAELERTSRAAAYADGSTWALGRRGGSQRGARRGRGSQRWLICCHLQQVVRSQNVESHREPQKKLNYGQGPV